MTVELVLSVVFVGMVYAGAFMRAGWSVIVTASFLATTWLVLFADGWNNGLRIIGRVVGFG